MTTPATPEPTVPGSTDHTDAVEPAGSVESAESAEAPAPARPAPGWTEIGVAAVGYVVVALVAVLGLFWLADQGPAARAIVTIGVSGVAALGAALLAVVVRLRSFGAFGVRAVSWRWLLVGLGAGVGAWLVNRVIIISYVLITGDTSNPQAEFLPGATGGAVALVLVLLLGAVLVPVGEELLFRGVLTTALGRYGVWVAVGVSALVFALAHGISIVLPAAFVLGVVNALLLRRSGSIWPGVVAHGVNNALVFGLTAILV